MSDGLAQPGVNPAPAVVPPPPMAGDTKVTRWVPIVIASLFGLIGLVVLGMILSSVNSHSALNLLKDVDVARGLITFVIAIGTVTIAIVLTLSAIISTNENIIDRLRAGREILTALLAVLGTIVGFYFGINRDAPTKVNPTPNPPVPAPQPAKTDATGDRPAKGGEKSVVPPVDAHKGEPSAKSANASAGGVTHTP